MKCFYIGLGLYQRSKGAGSYIQVYKTHLLLLSNKGRFVEIPMALFAGKVSVVQLPGWNRLPKTIILDLFTAPAIPFTVIL